MIACVAGKRSVGLLKLENCLDALSSELSVRLVLGGAVHLQGPDE